MEVREILAAAALGALASQVASRGAERYWRRAQRTRREDALRRLEDVTRQLQALQRPRQSPGTRWRAAKYGRYFVPAGLHLEQARRIVRERHQSLAQDRSAVNC
jgi:hypothetical protein